MVLRRIVASIFFWGAPRVLRALLCNNMHVRPPCYAPTEGEGEGRGRGEWWDFLFVGSPGE